MSNERILHVDRDEKTQVFVNRELHEYNVDSVRDYDEVDAEDYDLIITELGNSALNPEDNIIEPTIIHSSPWKMREYRNMINSNKEKDRLEKDEGYSGPGIKFEDRELYYVEKAEGSEGLKELVEETL